MKKHIVFAGCLLLFTITLQAGELDRKIKKLAQPFVEKAQAGEVVTVAVFPFVTDEKLAKKKVDVAVSELLTQELYRAGTFRLVERSQLDTVLKEQKLGLSGAIDSETAIRVGKLLGAQQIVLGSVSKLGKSYQINARLVDAQTGEIIAPSIVEVAVKVFDEEANRYLMLVPDQQSIGLQVVFLNLPCSISAGAAETFTPSFTGPFTATPRVTMYDCSAIGIGARYFPTSWLVIEGTFFLPSEDSMIIDVSDGGTGPTNITYNYSKQSIRLGAAYVYKLSQKMRLYGGLQLLVLYVDSPDDGNSRQVNIGSGGYNFMPKKEIEIIAPSLRAGMEWRPQPRIGLSVFGNFALGAKEKTATILISERDGSNMVDERTVDFFTVKYPAVSFEAAFSFYF